MRDIFRNLEGENKKFVAVDLNYDASKNQLSIKSAISKSTNNIISNCDLPNQEIQFESFVVQSNKRITDAITSLYGGIEDDYYFYDIDFFIAPQKYPSANSDYFNIPTAVYDSMRIVMAATPNLLSDLTYFVIDHLAWKPFIHTSDPNYDLNNVFIKECYVEDRGIGEFTELLFEDYYPLTDKSFMYVGRTICRETNFYVEKVMAI